MARYKKLSRDDLLDAALDVILDKGPHALSIGNVATAAGVTKGGIQSNFGTRENLIEALFERWTRELEDKCDEVAKVTGLERASLEVFLRATLEGQREKPRQDAAMIFLMMQTEKHRADSRAWVEDKLVRFGLQQGQDNPARLRFVILQSLLVVKSLELMPFDEDGWVGLIAELEQIFRK